MADTVKDLGSDVERWDAELTAYEKAARHWLDHAKRITKKYSLEDRMSSQNALEHVEGDVTGEASFNILWSNTQTLLPAMFARTPEPVVERRFRDRDPVGRIASQILQRALSTELETDNMFDTMSRVTLDHILVGRGTPWVRYEMHAGEIEEPNEYGEIVKVEKLASEKTQIDYVHWGDFAHSPLKTWPEVMRRGWVARRTEMTRSEGKARFKEKFEGVPLTWSADSSGQTTTDTAMDDPVLGTAQVWEIWDAVKRETVWICREHKDDVLDKRSDPLGLEGFFPCPEPAYGSLVNDSLMPTPDYLQIEKLATELSDITRRISKLVHAIQVRGFYDSSVSGLGRLLEDRAENMWPIDNMASQLGGGDINKVLQWMPIEPIAAALLALYDARDRAKQVIYEVSGIADIIRGQVDPREKLGQSKIKGQFATQRLGQRRQNLERCARGVLRIKAEIMSEQYSPDTLRELSGFDQLREVAELDDQRRDELFSKAHDLISSDKTRGFRIDIETDSTLALDDSVMKEDRIEFLTAAGQFLEQALPIADAVPFLAPALGETLLFVLRGFRAGRSLESAFEEAVEKMTEAGEQPPEPPPPDPKLELEQAKAEGQMKIMEQQGQQKAQEGQLKLVSLQAKSQADQAKSSADLEQVNADLMKTQMELQATLVKTQAELEALEQKYELERRSQLAKIAGQKKEQS